LSLWVISSRDEFLVGHGNTSGDKFEKNSAMFRPTAVNKILQQCKAQNSKQPKERVFVVPSI